MKSGNKKNLDPSSYKSFDDAADVTILASGAQAVDALDEPNVELDSLSREDSRSSVSSNYNQRYESISRIEAPDAAPKMTYTQYQPKKSPSFFSLLCCSLFSSNRDGEQNNMKDANDQTNGPENMRMK